MVTVKVEFYGPLRELVGGREAKVEVEEGSTPEDLLHRLATLYGPRFQEVVSEYTRSPEAPHFRSLLVCVNGRPIGAMEQGWKHGLREGETISFIPQIAGGRKAG